MQAQVVPNQFKQRVLLSRAIKIRINLLRPHEERAWPSQTPNQLTKEQLINIAMRTLVRRGQPLNNL